MMFPMDLSIVVTGIVCGLIFGFALERAVSRAHAN